MLPITSTADINEPLVAIFPNAQFKEASRCSPFRAGNTDSQQMTAGDFSRSDGIGRGDFLSSAKTPRGGAAAFQRGPST